MTLIQPDRHTLIMIKRPILRWIFAGVWGLFFLAFLAVSGGNLLHLQGNYILPMVMTYGGMAALPLGLLTTAPVIVVRFDRRKRKISYELKRWWGTRRKEASFDEISEVAVDKQMGRHSYMHFTVLRLRSGDEWALSQEGAITADGVTKLVETLRSFLDPDRPSSSAPVAPEREDHRPAAIALVTAALLLGAGTWTFIDANGLNQVPAAAESREARVARLIASGSGNDLLYVSRAYFEGDGVRQDKAEAVKWAVKSVEAGHLKASVAVGDMYGQGMGIPRDRAEAHVFYTIGAEAGIKYGIKAKARLEREMTPDELAEAARRLAAWKASH